MKTFNKIQTYLILLPLLYSLTSTAQDVQTFTTPNTAGGELKACEAVILKPGFTFTSQSGKSLVVGINESLCNPYTSKPVNLSPDQNYILKVVPLDASDKVDLTGSSVTLARGARALTTIQYYDGLGRPNEVIQVGASPSGKDLVSFTEYDPLSGMEKHNWLPGVFPGNQGAFVPLASITHNTPQSYQGDSRPFTENSYESSPLNRIRAIFGPGQTWKEASRSKQVDYLSNSSSSPELTCAYYYSSGNDLVRNGNYSTASLYLTKTTDENHHSSYEFKDKQGRVVLQRQLGSDNLLHDTHYIYDDFGNLRFVLPPMASDSTPFGSYNQTSTPIKHYAYLYRYDSRNRCIEKKLPGADWIHYIYDRSDRLILVQDGVQRNKSEWTFMKYDALGRLIMTGLKTIQSTRIDLQNQYWNTLIIETKIDDPYSTHGYTSTSALTTTFQDIQSVNYYDNYKWDNQYTCSPHLPYRSKEGFGSPHPSAQGQLTGTLTKMLHDPTNEIITAHYYDQRGNLVQQRSRNHLGGMDYTFLAYNFTNQVTRKHIEHTGPSSPLTEEYSYSYDHASRLQTTTYKTNNSPLTDVSYEYNELSQVGQKAIRGIETTQYLYTIRGWQESQKGSKFTEHLYYTSCPRGDVPLNYNGNITARQWSSPDSPTLHNQFFNYDPLDRIHASTYAQGPLMNIKMNLYDEFVSYDKHGNPINLYRNGRIDDLSHGMIDILEYRGYEGNQLTNIHDYWGGELRPDLMEYKNGEWGAILKYRYDANGNMTQDISKNMLKIDYNSLNLPKQIEFKTGDRIEYHYDAAGVKRTEKHTTQSTGAILTRDYIHNKVYENNTLTTVLTEEGYLGKKGNDFSPYYYLKDHLGSTRVVLDNTSQIVQSTDYYAFGLSFAKNPPKEDGVNQPYKFGGKELDRMFRADIYDFGARMYDPTIARFMTMDPLAEKYYSISPYAYCKNDPINRIDPDGMDDYRIDRDGNMVFASQTKADNHTVYATNSKGGIDKNNAIQVEKSFINSKQTEAVLGKYSSAADGNNAVVSSSVDTYTSFDTEQATQFFEFASNNTDVEWSQTNVSAEGIDGSLITTSHSDNSEVGQSKLVSNIISGNQTAEIVGGTQTTIIGANHSHPNGSTVVSYGDYKLAVKVQGAFPNATMHNYSPMSRQYTPFGRHSIPGMLQEIIITPNR